MSQRDYSRAEVEGDRKKCKSCQAWKDKNQDFNKWEGKCKMCRSAKRKGITMEEEMARLNLRNGISQEEKKELEEGRIRIEELKQQIQRDKEMRELQMSMLEQVGREREALKKELEAVKLNSRRIQDSRMTELSNANHNLKLGIQELEIQKAEWSQSQRREEQESAQIRKEMAEEIEELQVGSQKQEAEVRKLSQWNHQRQEQIEELKQQIQELNKRIQSQGIQEVYNHRIRKGIFG